MAVSTKQHNYKVAQVLHWIAFVIIVFNLLSGWRIENFALEIKTVLLMIHSGVGTTIFMLMAIRWWWRKKHHLYAPPRWWKRPTMVLQWAFYPLVVTQVLIGVAQAAFADFPVVAYGLIPYSSLGPADPTLQALFLGMHKWMAWLLITLVIVHALDRGRIFFKDDAAALAADTHS